MELAIVIMAAGKGTRLKSRRPKVLHEVGGRALVEHVVAAAVQVVEPKDIYVVIGHEAQQVRAALESTGVQFVEQTEQRGTGHAILTVRPAVEGYETILVLSGDAPMITTDTIGRFSIPLMIGVEDSLGAGEMSVFLCDGRDDPIREQYYLRTLLSRRVDGLIVTGRRARPRPPIGPDVPVQTVAPDSKPGFCRRLPPVGGGVVPPQVALPAGTAMAVKAASTDLQVWLVAP